MVSFGEAARIAGLKESTLRNVKARAPKLFESDYFTGAPGPGQAGGGDRPGGGAEQDPAQWRDGLAAAIRRERERVGLSLSELAKRAGVAKSTLSQLEAGTGNRYYQNDSGLSVSMTEKLAVKLGFQVRYNSTVEPGVKNADELFTTNLVYNF